MDYKGRKIHSQKELEEICETYYEENRLMFGAIASCKDFLNEIKNFDYDSPFDDPGHAARLGLRMIDEKLSEITAKTK